MGGFVDFDPERDAGLNAKLCVYNRLAPAPARSSSVSRTGPHNLYAPYYTTNIPATSRDPWGAASGTDGPVYSDYTGQPNNFGGLRMVRPVSVLGDRADPRPEREPGHELPAHDAGLQADYRQTNGFPTSIVEFTDEHGEVRAQWQPGVDNDHFGTTVGFVDDNGGCDLEGVNLGAQTITAAARYPFQHVANDVAVTGTITKNINNLFRKTLSCVRKNNVSSAVAYICTATARDIAGNGDVFNGEKVCFSREPDNVWYNVGGSTAHPNGYCVPLSGGTATAPASVSAETPGTLIGSLIDVQGYFAGEKLLRDTCIVSGGQQHGWAVPARRRRWWQRRRRRFRWRRQDADHPTEGRRQGHGGLGAARHDGEGPRPDGEVRSTKSTAKIQVRLINAKGHVIKNALRAVKTNKRVKVKNLRITKRVKTVRVRVVS